MDVFDLRQRLVDDYASYARRAAKIADPTIGQEVNTQLYVGIVPRTPIHPTGVRFATVAPAQPRSTSRQST
jgi:hypothetical protein